MKQNKHSRRYAEDAQAILANILLYEVSDPDLEFVTISGVDVSVDKRAMHVFVTCEPERYDKVLKALERAKGHIRRELGMKLNWRVIPELSFAIDPSMDEAERIEAALQNRISSLEREDDGE